MDAMKLPTISTGRPCWLIDWAGTTGDGNYNSTAHCHWGQPLRQRWRRHWQQQRREHRRRNCHRHKRQVYSVAGYGSGNDYNSATATATSTGGEAGAGLGTNNDHNTASATDRVRHCGDPVYPCDHSR
jgi:hypothetical protein